MKYEIVSSKLAAKSQKGESVTLSTKVMIVTSQQANQS